MAAGKYRYTEEDYGGDRNVRKEYSRIKIHYSGGEVVGKEIKVTPIVDNVEITASAVTLPSPASATERITHEAKIALYGHSFRFKFEILDTTADYEIYSHGVEQIPVQG